MRAVVDTNVWISAVLNASGLPARVYKAYRAGQFEFLTTDALLAELDDVLSRPQLVRKHQRHPGRASELVATLRERARLVVVTGEVRLCRDPDDDLVIETALKGGADVVVSRDEDLTRDWEVVEPLRFAGIRVLTVYRFLQELKGEADDPMPT